MTKSLLKTIKILPGVTLVLLAAHIVNKVQKSIALLWEGNKGLDDDFKERRWRNALELH